MKYEEIVSIIQQFRKQHYSIVTSSKVHGLIVRLISNEPFLVLLVTEKIEKEKLLEDEIMLSVFSYNFENERKDIKCAVEISDIPKIHDDVLLPKENLIPIKGGDVAHSVGSAFQGTAGWNLYLNGVLVSMTNWHVLCYQGNNTPLGIRVEINGSNVASLYLFKPIYASGYNSLDYALAKFDNPSDVVGSMEKCSDGSTLPYPQQLSKNVRIGDGETYTKVGAKAPLCRSGTLIAIGDRKVDYNGTLILFSYQLIFSKMTDSGDSGAVIVRKSDTTVTGLNFAGNENETIANPIFINNWIYKGSVSKDGRTSIPMFETTLMTEDIVMEFSSRMNYDDPIPDLAKGKVFLGVRLAYVVPGRGDVVQWISPEYAPIRPNVPVVYVPVCVHPQSKFYAAQEVPGENVGWRQWIFFAFG